MSVSKPPTIQPRRSPSSSCQRDNQNCHSQSSAITHLLCCCHICCPAHKGGQVQWMPRLILEWRGKREKVKYSCVGPISEYGRSIRCIRIKPLLLVRKQSPKEVTCPRSYGSVWEQINTQYSLLVGFLNRPEPAQRSQKYFHQQRRIKLLI